MFNARTFVALLAVVAMAAAMPMEDTPTNAPTTPTAAPTAAPTTPTAAPTTAPTTPTAAPTAAPTTPTTAPSPGNNTKAPTASPTIAPATKKCHGAYAKFDAALLVGDGGACKVATNSTDCPILCQTLINNVCDSCEDGENYNEDDNEVWSPVAYFGLLDRVDAENPDVNPSCSVAACEARMPQTCNDLVSDLIGDVEYAEGYKCPKVTNASCPKSCQDKITKVVEVCKEGETIPYIPNAPFNASVPNHWTPAQLKLVESMFGKHTMCDFTVAPSDIDSSSLAPWKIALIVLGVIALLVIAYCACCRKKDSTTSYDALLA